MKAISKWFARGAELIAAALLAAIFFTFIIQIFSRYAPNIAWLMPIPSVSDWMSGLQPIGWTVNLISLLWVYAVFFGCAFVVRERDHVTFDVLYLAMPKTGRVVFAFLSAVGVIAALLWALPATWEAIFASRLTELKKIQTLRVPFTGAQIAIKWLFAPVVMLMLVAVVRYLWRIVTIARDGPPDTELEDLLSPKAETETEG